ncbi:MAG: hypothetical protein HQ503_15130, partial [Rhodospirillales bacterium]|nr:hypothetical protein [Rhodospirillales bacterium]
AAGIAAANAARLGLSARAHVISANWSDALDARFDIIIANPPYVRTRDWQGLAPTVRDFEPRSALVAGDDGLVAYRQILPRLPGLLADDGIAALEIGWDQAAAVGNLVSENGLIGSDPLRDLAGRDRCILATLKKT